MSLATIEVFIVRSRLPRHIDSSASVPSPRAKTLAVSEDQRGTASAEGTQRVRTDRAGMYRDVPAAADGSRVQYAPIESRNDLAFDDSVRTERARSGGSDPERPLGPDGWARKATADHLKLTLERRMSNDEEWASNRALAPKCGVDEAVIRKWRGGEKSIPLCALLVLPVPIVKDMVALVLEKRALNSHRSGVPMLREALQRLEGDVPEADRDAVLDVLAEASAQITARLSRLARGGR